MRTVKMKSGGHIVIVGKREEFQAGEICFTEAEYTWAVKMCAGVREPEEIRSFWATLIEKKQADPLYDYLVDFPPGEPVKELAKTERAVETDTQRMARETMEMMRGERAWPKNA